MGFWASTKTTIRWASSTTNREICSSAIVLRCTRSPLAIFTFAFLEQPNPNFSIDYVARVSPLAWERALKIRVGSRIGRRHFFPRSILSSTILRYKRTTRVANTVHTKTPNTASNTVLFLSFFLSFFLSLLGKTTRRHSVKCQHKTLHDRNSPKFRRITRLY